MKHRHRLQQQRHKAASRTKGFEVDEAADEQAQPGSSRAKKRVRHHEMAVEGKRPRARLDKYARGSRRPKRFDDGGVAGGSTRSPNDPGGELDAANKGRKSTLDWIKDEIMGGPRPAYKHGGRQRPRRYDDGGLVDGSDVAPSTSGPSLGSGLGSAFSDLGTGFAALAKARGSGPPPLPPPAAPPAPQANNASFIRQQQAAQASQRLKSRIAALEAGGGKSLFPGAPKVPVPGIKRGGRAKPHTRGRP